MKKILKLIALILALVLIVGIAGFADSLVGNPISNHLAVKGTESYLSAQYSGTDYYIDRTVYNFKDGNYHSFILSPSSADTAFTVIADKFGRVLYDTFSSVTAKENTARRLEGEYRELTDTILNSPSFPYAGDIVFGTLSIYPKQAMEDPHVTDIPSYAIVQDDLILDKEYDIRTLGAQAGRLVIYVEEDHISAERAAEIMLDIKRLMDQVEIPFRVMDFHLVQPLPAEGPRSDVRIDVPEFPYAELYEEDLIYRIQAYDRESKQKDMEK